MVVAEAGAGRITRPLHVVGSLVDANTTAVVTVYEPASNVEVRSYGAA